MLSSVGGTKVGAEVWTELHAPNRHIDKIQMLKILRRILRFMECLHILIRESCALTVTLSILVKELRFLTKLICISNYINLTVVIDILIEIDISKIDV